MKVKSFLKVLVAMFSMLTLAAGHTARANEITVYDGTTTNDKVPIYGYWADALTQSQFIIEAAELSTISGSFIDNMTFYLNQASINFGAATFEVYLGEVAQSNFSNATLVDWSTLSQVYSGSVTISDNKMKIYFDFPYPYQGGNLLVGFNQTVKGSYSTTSWYGVPATDASMGGYNSNPALQPFRPKTTFEYSTGGASGAIQPKNVSATVDRTSATVRWLGYNANYNVRYRKAAGIEKFLSETFEGDMSRWTVIRNGEGSESTDWQRIYVKDLVSSGAHGGDFSVMARSWGSGEGPYNADNWLISPAITLDGTLTYWVKDDGGYHEHYDIYVSTTDNNLSSFTKIYEPGDATDEWAQHTVDLSSYAGVQGYIAFRNTDYDKDYLLIDDITITGGEAPAGAWTTLTATASPLVITGLDAETDYEVQVQAVNGSNVSEWSSSFTFTTGVDGDAVPHDLSASPSYHSANVSWTGNSDGYTLRYRLKDTTEWTTVNNITGTSYTITGLALDSEYQWQVQGVSGGNVTEWAILKSFTTKRLSVPSIGSTFAQHTTAIVNLAGDADTYNVKYRRLENYKTKTFYENFEGDLIGWTMILNGEGKADTTDWHKINVRQSSFSVSAHSDSYAMLTRSYYNEEKFNADNWLISPKVKLNGTLRFWVVDDGSWHEHLEVYVSTTTTELSAFTKIAEAGDATDTWTEKTVDLSSFNGQVGYIAFRNIDYDKDWLLLDDVSITEGAATPGTDWIEFTTTNPTLELTGLNMGTTYEIQVQSIIGSDETEWSRAYPFSTHNAGDMNADGKFGVSDVTAVVNKVKAGVYDATADFDGDSDLDTDDVEKLVKQQILRIVE